MVIHMLGNIIGHLLGSDESLYNEEDTISTCFRPGILLDTGISWVKFLRKVLVAGMVVGNSNKPQNTKCDPVCRASELPIYMNENDCYEKSSDIDLCPPKPGIIESTFGSLRRSIWGVMDKCSLYRKDVEDSVERGSEYATSMYKYLQEESDNTTKMAAVGVGALTGFVLGLRGGFFRRILFSGAGAYTMCAVCYPQQTAEYSQEAIKETRKYATITYNFVYGVKKDDIPLPQLPKLPSSMGEMWDMAGELGKSASSLITGSSETNEKIAEVESSNVEIKSSDEVVKQSHATASGSCHCPVGACLGRHEQENVTS